MLLDILGRYPAAEVLRWRWGGRHGIPEAEDEEGSPRLCAVLAMMFSDDESIFKLVDQFERGNNRPGDINKHLDVVQYQGNFLSLMNSRLAALMM